ncbi:MAG: hypothetical protein WCL06_05630, partial [Bacteroidota bacterium]
HSLFFDLKITKSSNFANKPDQLEFLTPNKSISKNRPHELIICHFYQRYIRDTAVDCINVFSDAKTFYQRLAKNEKRRKNVVHSFITVAFHSLAHCLHSCI